jgi:predicted DNA-binding transcriptional regulator AlpA
MNGTSLEKECYINQKEAAKYLGIAVPTIKKWKNKFDDFPKPIRISEQAVLFKKKELDEWMEKRKAQ